MAVTPPTERAEIVATASMLVARHACYEDPACGLEIGGALKFHKGFAARHRYPSDGLVDLRSARDGVLSCLAESAPESWTFAVVKYIPAGTGKDSTSGTPSVE